MRRDRQTMEGSDGEEYCRLPQPKRRRPPALARYFVEALRRHHLLTQFSSQLEPIIRRIVSEELERALASRMTPVRTVEGCPPKQIEGRDDKKLQLHFRNKLPHTILTGEEIQGELGAAVHVLLLDAKTGCHVTSGPEASVKLDVVVLRGDFGKGDGDDWTAIEFEEYVAKPRERKRPLLIGETQVCMKEGLGTLGKLNFTDNSSWDRSRRFRLGLKVAAGFCDGTRIREAKTEGFMVKEQRAHGKHHPPVLEDEIWRLESIGKDGSYQKKLNEEGIITVRDFLLSYKQDSKKLRKILGSGMSNNKWEKLVNHASTAVLNGNFYVYYSDETRKVGAIFNSRYVFCGLIENKQFTAMEGLKDDRQKGLADKLIHRAYDNWKDVCEYDCEENLKSIQSEGIIASQGAALPSSSSPNDKLGMLNETENTVKDAALPTSYSFNRYFGMLDEMENAVNDAALPSSSSFNRYLGMLNEMENAVNDAAALPSSSSLNRYFGMLDEMENAVNDAALPSSSSPNHYLGILNEMENAENGAASLSPAEHIERHPYRSGTFDGLSPLEEGCIRYCTQQMIDDDNLWCSDDMIAFASSSSSHNYHNLGNEEIVSPRKSVITWVTIVAALRWAIFIRRKAAERRS